MGEFPTIAVIRSEKESRANIQALIWNKISYNYWFTFSSCYLKNYLKLVTQSLLPKNATIIPPDVFVSRLVRLSTFPLSQSGWPDVTGWESAKHDISMHLCGGRTGMSQSTPGLHTHTEQEKKKKKDCKNVWALWLADGSSRFLTQSHVSWTGCFFGVGIHSFKFSHDG